MVSSSEMTIMESPLTDNAFRNDSSSNSALAGLPSSRLIKNSMSYRNSMSSVDSCDCADDCTEDNTFSCLVNTAEGDAAGAEAVACPCTGTGTAVPVLPVR
ncbi:hypothetical protein D3C87_1758050 [compost metagenome]